ncbi:hypothetical protein SDC9_133063 [bioreactor metagenome]|uniref:Uncharacterized protein n=1 Tax=bioreactor metagenome TaxID=1076179 RepID=A0A645D8V9_9ZZZZ
MQGIEARKALLRFKERIERVFALPIDLQLCKPLEGGAEVEGAELVDLLDGPGSLLLELVAGEVENLKTLFLVRFIELFQFIVLGCKAAVGCRVDDQQYLALKSRKLDWLSVHCRNFNIV